VENEGGREGGREGRVNIPASWNFMTASLSPKVMAWVRAWTPKEELVRCF